YPRTASHYRPTSFCHGYILTSYCPCTPTWIMLHTWLIGAILVVGILIVPPQGRDRRTAAGCRFDDEDAFPGTHPTARRLPRHHAYAGGIGPGLYGDGHG